MNTLVLNYKSDNKKAIYRGRVSIAHYKIHPPTTFFLIIYYLHYIHALFQATFYMILTLFRTTFYIILTLFQTTLRCKGTKKNVYVQEKFTFIATIVIYVPKHK